MEGKPRRTLITHAVMTYHDLSLANFVVGACVCARADVFCVQVASEQLASKWADEHFGLHAVSDDFFFFSANASAVGSGPQHRAWSAVRAGVDEGACRADFDKMRLTFVDGSPSTLRLRFATARGNATERCALAALAYLASQHEVDALEPAQQMRSLSRVQNAAERKPLVRGAHTAAALEPSTPPQAEAAARRRLDAGGDVSVRNELGAVSVQSGASIDGTPLWDAGITGTGQFVQVGGRWRQRWSATGMACREDGGREPSSHGAWHSWNALVWPCAVCAWFVWWCSRRFQTRGSTMRRAGSVTTTLARSSPASTRAEAAALAVSTTTALISTRVRRIRTAMDAWRTIPTLAGAGVTTTPTSARRKCAAGAAAAARAVLATTATTSRARCR